MGECVSTASIMVVAVLHCGTCVGAEVTTLGRSGQARTPLGQAVPGLPATRAVGPAGTHGSSPDRMHKPRLPSMTGARSGLEAWVTARTMCAPVPTGRD